MYNDYCHKNGKGTILIKNWLTSNKVIKLQSFILCSLQKEWYIKHKYRSDSRVYILIFHENLIDHIYISQLNTFYCLVALGTLDMYILCITAPNRLLQSPTLAIIHKKTTFLIHSTINFLNVFLKNHKQYWTEQFCTRSEVHLCWIIDSLME